MRRNFEAVKNLDEDIPGHPEKLLKQQKKPVGLSSKAHCEMHLEKFVFNELPASPLNVEYILGA